MAIFLRQDRLVLPGVRETAHAVLDRTGIFRHAGPGTLELAWVAAGRLDAWIQPETDPWDWLPGRLLVDRGRRNDPHRPQETSAGTSPGSSSLVDALVALLT